MTPVVAKPALPGGGAQQYGREVDADRFVAEVRRGGRRLSEAADGHLEATVPPCPGWTVADLVAHVSVVVDFWGAVLDGVAADAWHPDPALTGSPSVAVLDERVAALCERLDGADPAARCWTWSPANQTVGWVQRRMAHELTVHAWDGQSAVGAPDPIPTDLGVDGIDEFLACFLGRGAEGAAAVGGSVHLHPTDADGAGEWEITPAPPGSERPFEVRSGHAKADAALRGPASALLLALWRRSEDGVEVLGDEALARRFLDATSL